MYPPGESLRPWAEGAAITLSQVPAFALSEDRPEERVTR